MPSYQNGRTFSRVQRVFTQGPNSDLSTFVNAGKLSWTDNFNGQENPSWKDMIKQHRNAGTPASGDRFRIVGRTSGLCNFVLKKKHISASHEQITRRISGDILDVGDLFVISPYTNPPLRQKVINLALARFYQKAWDAIRSFEGGTFLGELKESLSMIRHPGKALRRGIDVYGRDVRRRLRKLYRTGNRLDPARIADAHRIATDTWLEYVFGWSPLINDVKSGAEALARLALRPYDYKLVAAVEKGEEEITIPSSLYTYSKILDGSIRFWIQNRGAKATILCRYLGEVKCEIQNPLLMREEVLGFTWNDFAPTVWNLIPYSFLVDYFTNIGDVISAWSFPQHKISWHNRTIRHSSERTVLAKKRPTPNPNSAWWEIISDTGPDLKVHVSRTQFTRDQDPLGFPTVTLELPGASRKWLNIAALAGARMA